jgi:hypothetical protein
VVRTTRSTATEKKTNNPKKSTPEFILVNPQFEDLHIPSSVLDVANVFE